jgi:spore germination protein YaaH
LVFSVVAVARTKDFEDTYGFYNWSGVYDYKAIAENCDFVSLMAYDDPNSAGPSASLPFTLQSIEYAKDKIPAEKLSLGIPLYYWQWNVDQAKRVNSGLYSGVSYIKSIVNYTSGFDWNLGEGWIAYYYNNKYYKIWFEDQVSFLLKLNAAKLSNLRGFSAWLLGGEDPGIWSSL